MDGGRSGDIDPERRMINGGSYNVQVLGLSFVGDALALAWPAMRLHVYALAFSTDVCTFVAVEMEGGDVGMRMYVW